MFTSFNTEVKYSIFDAGKTIKCKFNKGDNQWDNSLQGRLSDEG